MPSPPARKRGRYADARPLGRARQTKIQTPARGPMPTSLELPDLPVAECLPRLLAVLGAQSNAVLVAPPGAGKNTSVPLARLDAPPMNGGRILMLEPRRLAARAAANRMARLIGEKVGRSVDLRT